MFVFALMAMTCVADVSERRPPLNAPSTPEPRSQAVEQDTQPHHSVRSLDFANFTFPWVAELADPDYPTESFTVRDGEFTEGSPEQGASGEMSLLLRSVVYGDATGDGAEEAMVVLSVVTGGSSIPHVVYVYTLEGEYPKLLWAFYTGDRADGGLRQVRADKGRFVVERYSPEGSKGVCCPTRFIRTHYKWGGNSFERIGKEEVLRNSDLSGSPITPPTRRHNAAAG